MVQTVGRRVNDKWGFQEDGRLRKIVFQDTTGTIQGPRLEEGPHPPFSVMLDDIYQEDLLHGPDNHLLLVSRELKWEMKCSDQDESGLSWFQASERQIRV